MTYATFKETLLSELTGHFPPDTSIHIHSIPRNNRVAEDGLTILESGFNIAPTIYIQEYYNQMKKGASFLTVYKRILDTYYEYRPMDNIDTALFCDFNNMQHHVVYKLISYERNLELLKQIPHIKYLDLAMVFYCLIASGSTGTATILIQNSHLELWNSNLNELYRLAKINTPKLMPARFEKLSSLLSDNFPSADHKMEDLSDCLMFPIYVLTNDYRFLGAACILYEGLLEDLAVKMDTDFYIIPSSVHEVLLIPVTADLTKEDLNQMIQEVNATQLEPEEVLSDHLYLYTREKNQVTS